MTIDVTKNCFRCGYEWFAKVPHPICCPRCKSYFWDIPKCDNCGKDAADHLIRDGSRWLCERCIK